jgi:hypothetical protein
MAVLSPVGADTGADAGADATAGAAAAVSGSGFDFRNDKNPIDSSVRCRIVFTDHTMKSRPKNIPVRKNH